MILCFAYYSLLFPSGEMKAPNFGDITPVWLSSKQKCNMATEGCP